MPIFVKLSISGQTPTWYRLAKHGDFVEALECCDEHSSAYIRGWLNNPHWQADFEKGDIGAWLRDPRILIPKKSQAVLGRIQESELYFNRHGGWCCPHNGVIRLATIESEAWPAEVEKLSGHRATIKRWPDGQHYYVSFFPRAVTLSRPKFNTLEEAVTAARELMPEDKITVENGDGYSLREGD